MPADLDRLHREQNATNGLFLATGVVAAASLSVFAIETWAKKPSVTVATSGAGAKMLVQW